VTGAAGFVGAVLVRKLLDEGHDVHAMVRPRNEEATPWRLRGVDVPVVSVDLSNEPGVREVVKGVRPEWIFHLAAHGGYSSQTNVRRMIESNVLATIHLVEACLREGFEAFVNTGSSSEYGFCDHAPAEDETPEPTSHYAVTKLTATLYCRAVARREGVHLPTLRLYSVYGPFEEPSRFIPALAVRGIEGRLPPLVTPEVARDFVFVDDVAEAYLLAASHRVTERGEIYNVGTGRQLTIGNVVDTARKTLDIQSEPEWQTLPNRSWDTTSWVANPDKIRRELSWTARTTFEDGFRTFVQWLQDSPERLQIYRTPPEA
jgi:dolichol-phosphate mannosyltransferase